MNYKGKKDQKFKCRNCKGTFPFKGYSSNHVYCSLLCMYKYATKKKDVLREKRYKDWLSGKLTGLKNPRRLIRGFVTKRDGYKCSVCGITEHNGKPISLWCDHIDGDATNNKPNNFRLICPNCDSQSDTFGSKNRGKGRKSRGLPQYG